MKEKPTGNWNSRKAPPSKSMRKINLKNNRRPDQEFFISLLFFVICCLLFLFFPTNRYAQRILAGLFFLAILPGAYIKLILGKSLADFGINLKEFPKNFSLTLGAIALVSILFYFLAQNANFLSHYKLSPLVVSDFRFFLAYELLYLNLIIFIFSVFSYGYLLSLLRKKFYAWSVCVQLALYLATLILTNSFGFESLFFSLLFVAGTLLAHQTRSFFYSYFMHISAIILFDAYYIHLISK